MSIDYKVDYHIHSYYSDGTMSPVELVRKYHDEEYAIISITDHDGIDGVKEALTAGEALRCIKEQAWSEPEIVQVQISRGRRAGAVHLMEGQNPVYVISFCGKRESDFMLS